MEYLMTTHIPEITIHHESTYGTADIYHLVTEKGGVEAVYHTDERRYTIANFDVDVKARRRGIGKELLRASQTHARELGAKVVFAVIISRECLDAMRSVFGEESVFVAEEGGYDSGEGAEPKARTSAVLEVRFE